MTETRLTKVTKHKTKTKMNKGNLIGVLVGGGGGVTTSRHPGIMGRAADAERLLVEEVGH